MKGRPTGRRRRAVALAAVGAVVAGAASLSMGGVAQASSHREAPLTAGDPQHDNTDVYAFTSPDKPDTVTLIADWIPFEEPNGGPNFYPWAQGSHYDINIDSAGTGNPSITYRWTFKNVDTRGNQPGGGSFLYNNGVVNHLTDPTLLFKQTYTLQKIVNGKATVIGTGTSAPSDVGAASMPNYTQLRKEATVPLAGGGQTVATQAADPFFLDLRVFDLLYGGNLSETGQNSLKGYNVNSVALQVPKSELALNGNATKNPVIGVWSTTEKQTLQLTGNGKTIGVGPYVQVSRLGNPLVNELVVPAQLKDGFNALKPYQDAGVPALVSKVLNPELPALIQSIYGIPAPATPRTDLQEIFLTGITTKAGGPIKTDLNSQLNNADVSAKAFVPGEELRLNMSVPVTASPNRLGVLAGDLQGFPNGRRLTDDVVDIEIQAFEGAAQTGKIVPALAAGDGVDHNANNIGSSFPYLALPNSVGVNTAGSK